MSVSIDFLSCLKLALSYLHPEKELLEESDKVLDGADLVLSFLHSSIDGSPSNTGCGVDILKILFKGVLLKG